MERLNFFWSLLQGITKPTSKLSTMRKDKRINWSFFDNSKNKAGFQCIGNRLKDIFKEIILPYDLTESNDVIRVRLKKYLGFTMRETQGPHPNKDTKDSGVPELEVREISSAEKIYMWYAWPDLNILTTFCLWHFCFWFLMV